MSSASFKTASCSRKAPSNSFATNTASRTWRRFSSRWLRPTMFPRRITSMSLRNVGIVYRKELTEALRDRRTLISSILIPLFLFPVLTFGIGYAFVEIAGEATREPSKIMILGGEDSPDVVRGLQDAKNLRVVRRSLDYVDLISDKKIRAAVDIPPGFQSGVARGEHPEVKIYIFRDDLKSMLAAGRVEKLFT